MNGELIKLFEELCPEEKFSGCLFHGSEVSGAIEIVEGGGFHPGATEGTHHTSLPLVSTSQNDNVLSLFGNGTGFCFCVPDESPLCVRRLHNFFHAATTAYETNCDELEVFLNDPGWAAAAKRTGIVSETGKIIGLPPDAFMALLGDNCDGLAFPGFESQHPMAEAELGLTQKGCARVWAHLDHVIVNGEYFDAKEGVTKLRGMGDGESESPALPGRTGGAQALGQQRRASL